MILTLVVFAQAQSDFPYLVENIETGNVVRRAVSDTRGIPSTELILRPNASYRLWMLEAASLRVGMLDFQTPTNGRSFVIPAVTFRNPITPDSDGDGLHDEAEYIIGTNAINPDTDNDGISDGAEYSQGTNPLDGLIVQTGIIATVDTQGDAIHVHGFDDLAVVTEAGRGIVIFNVFNAMAPVIVGRVDTPGNAIAAHFSGSLIAVAGGEGGLAVVDAGDPPSATVTRTLSATLLGGWAQAVVTTADIAYVGTDNGTVHMVDMVSGNLLQEIQVDENQVQDLAVSGDLLFALTDAALYLYDLSNDRQLLSRITVSGSTAPLEIGRKLFATSDFAYVGYFQGYSVVDVSDPFQPEIVGEPTGTQAAIHDLVLNGSGLLAATTSFAGVGTLALSLYDASDPTDVTGFLTSFETPGASRAVSMYNGLAYVADTDRGLQVFNLQSYDSLGIPPVIELKANFSLNPPRAEEGSLVRVTAQVADDVQVRNVEFYLDGVKAATDGSFPFEFRFLAPLMAESSGFTLQARASDTGGNATWTDPMEVALVEDGTPPRVLRVNPQNNAAIGNQDTLTAFFSEPLDPASLTPTNFSLWEAGADGIFATADDSAVAGTLQWREEITAALLAFPQNLIPGFYRISLTSTITDLAGNGLNEPFTSTFRIYDPGKDRDGDGVPDDLEPLLGLDPDNPDSDGNGVPDGDEDFDMDGLTNLQEVVLGLDPTDPDQDNDGIPDGLSDSDGDGLTDLVEVFFHGTDPNNHDTDGDFFGDRDEIQDGSDPLDPNSLPPTLFQGMVLQFSIQNKATTDSLAITVLNKAYPQSLTIQNTTGPGLREKNVVSPVVGVENQ